MTDGRTRSARLKPFGIALLAVCAFAIAAAALNLTSNPSVPDSAAGREASLARPMEPIEPLPPEVEPLVHPYGNPAAKEQR